ncbi:glycosyltransferase [Rhodococcus sp. IEGM 1381]|uniref:glycosyltransferase family 2 protein n=1 Tax=Rhodococcus sp. IEGM 1381 TaxID=3047085 RepID=UPI0024B74306|nr:glycosyltransferase [Rhodococcus sp. IEGM 1381]MDI9898002.1 glycosyltransferase [Rhodococcus sp. IEGM 1381]
MSAGLVSVIIPAYNGLPDLDDQLSALEAQDFDGKFEVIISDNGSTDGLREHIAQLESPLDIRWIDSSGVRGTPHARNAGIDAARGDFLAFTDQDDAVYPGWLTALTRAAETFDAVGGPIEVQTLNSEEVASWRAVPAPEERFETGYLPFAHGNNFGMWRRVVDQVGKFDESFLGGGEDADISWRIQQAGLTLGHVPDAMVAYRLRRTARAAYEQGIGYGRSGWEVTHKHEPNGARQPSARELATFVYMLTVRNPWLPKALSPLPKGMWAMSAGSTRATISMRLRHALTKSGLSRLLPGR